MSATNAPRACAAGGDGPRRRAAMSLVTALVTTASLTGCTSGEESAEETTKPTTAQQQSPAEAVMVTTKVTKVAGRLSKKERATLADEVGSVLQRYVDDAFLGDYPRRDFADAFATFTPGAAKLAKKDAALASGKAYGDAASVTADRLKATLAVLAPKGRPAGVTATVRFAFEYDGAPATYAGRLMLTREKRSWRIFGYDLSRNDRATGADQ